MLKCSFDKITLRDTFEPVWEFGTELYGRFFYLESETEKLLLAAFDFVGIYPCDAKRWKVEISKLTGIPEKGIWFHELQIHAAPGGVEMHGAPTDRLIAKSAPVIRRMVENAVEFDCDACEADFGTEFTFNREQYVEGLGGVTVWTGMTFDEQNRPCTQNKDIMLLRGYKPSLPVFDKPIYFDNPNDPKAYLFVFRDKRGNVLGSISRFAGHPDVAVLFELRFNPNRANEYHYNFDWPGYISADLEDVFGGVSMYVNGPCADLSTKKSYDGMDTYADSDGDCRRLAKLIGGRLKEEFSSHSYRVDTSLPFLTNSFEIELPMNEDVPYSRAELENWQAKVDKSQRALDDAIAEGKPAYAVKKLIDDRWRTGHMPHIVNETSFFSDEELATHTVKVCVTAFRFGGYLFVGVPGESLVDMTLWLRSQFTGVKTIPVDQVGGYYNYVATPRSLTLGGYTYWSSWVRRDATLVLKQQLTKLIRDFLK